VVKLHEAITLSDAAIRKPVLLMGPFDAGELPEIVRRRIMPMVYTPIGDDIDRVASRFGGRVRLHVCVDTGIGRVGVPVKAAAPLIRDLASRRSVATAATMITFSEDAEFDAEQLPRFTRLTSSPSSDGVHMGRRH